ARALGDQLNAWTGSNYAREGAQRQLIFLTHSMGALVARLAVCESHVDARNVRAMIHMAPPLLGSARAFRAIYGRNVLPMLSDLVQLYHLRPNGGLALQNLSNVL